MARPLTYNREFRNANWTHFSSFQNVHKRCKRNGTEIDPEFSMSDAGFRSFVDYLGPVPDGMIKPTAGRKDHSKGYIRGNFEWQSSSDNSKESSVRSWMTTPEIRLLYARVNLTRTARGSKGVQLKEYLNSMRSGEEISMQELKSHFKYYCPVTVRKSVSRMIWKSEVLGSLNGNIFTK